MVCLASVDVFLIASANAIAPRRPETQRYAENTSKITHRMQLVESNSSELKGGKLVENKRVDY